MAIASGARLGPYEIDSFIGAGGMGEVYRAKDTRLGRDVAIKVLPSSMAADPDRLRRFEHEARAAGALNHPNIVAILDVGLEHGMPYLVSELLEGETLRECVEHGPVSPRKALDYATQIACGLEAAHSKGIIHRDLKPENLFLTREGRVKILDFGLAKRPMALQAATQNPTLTQAGALVGTVGYMSPEQVRGAAADQRSDIFSFGAILYEMLVGSCPFQRDSAAETMTAILKEEPAALAGLENRLPPALDRIVRRCLEKEPEARFGSAHELVFALEAVASASSSPSQEGARQMPLAKPRRAVHRLVYAAAGLIAGIVLGGAGMFFLKPAGAMMTPTLRDLTYSGHDFSPAVSPDGRTIAFASDRDGRSRIWLKQLPAGGEVALTEGPDDLPRFAPDGGMILFIRDEGPQLALYRTETVAGLPRDLLHDVDSADWSPDGREIAFVRSASDGTRSDSIVGLVNADGSNPREIVRIRNERLLNPRFSPDGKAVALVPAVLNAGGPQHIYLVDVERKQTQRVPASKVGFGISSVAWSGPRELIYSTAESAAGSVVGNAGSSAYMIRHDLRSGGEQRLFWSPYGSQLVEIAGAGRLIFDTRSSRESLRELHAGGSDSGKWLTRGNSNDRQPVFSPDGEWVVFSSNRSGNLDLWATSTSSGAVRRITDGPSEDWDPAITSDGKRLFWSSNRTGAFEIWTAAANGIGARQVTHDGVDAENPTVTPDGKWIVYASGDRSKEGIWKIREDGSGATRLVGGSASLPELSPDGQYVAYTVPGPKASSLRFARLEDGANVSPEFRIPVKNGKLAGSIGRSRWMPDGRAIAFVGQDDKGVTGIYVQDFAPGKDTSSTRRALGGFDPEIATESFGISHDGTRIVIASWEQVFSLILADGVAGVSAAR